MEIKRRIDGSTKIKDQKLTKIRLCNEDVIDEEITLNKKYLLYFDPSN